VTLTFLGTGTSHGIPVIGCSCGVCRSRDPRDNRTRASAFVRGVSASLLIDAGPEFRIQAIRQKITSVDAVLITHGHADHIHGLDDLRIFSTVHPRFGDGGRRPIPLYANESTLADIENRFSYISKPAFEGGGKPNLAVHPCEGFTPEHPLVVGGLSIVHIPMRHGSLAAAGWVISEGEGSRRVSVAYLTDCNGIPDESIETIRRAARVDAGGRLAHVALDALRVRPHSTHFCFDEALECAKKIAAKRTWITHLCHDMSHEDAIAYFKERGAPSVMPAHDGLSLRCESA
jgi:phosphoribosyl 1,2-cyclic phosphate phosphodiesterase